MPRETALILLSLTTQHWNERMRKKVFYWLCWLMMQGIVIGAIAFSISDESSRSRCIDLREPVELCRQASRSALRTPAMGLSKRGGNVLRSRQLIMNGPVIVPLSCNRASWIGSDKCHPAARELPAEITTSKHGKTPGQLEHVSIISIPSGIRASRRIATCILPFCCSAILAQ